MVWQVSVAVSLSTLPITLDVKIVSCGVKTEGLAKEHPEPEDILSKLSLVITCIQDIIPLFCESSECAKYARLTYTSGRYNDSMLTAYGNRTLQSAVLSTSCASVGSPVWPGRLPQSYNASYCG